MTAIASGATPARRLEAGTLQRVLLACGVLSSLVYVAANVAAGLSWPGYSFAAQTISELSAIGAPSRSVWIPFGVAYDVLLIAFGVGVWRSAAENLRVRLAAAMLIAIGAIGAFWPPMHLRGRPTSLTDTLHIVWAVAVSLLIMLAIGFGAAVAGRRFRLFSFATLGGMVLFGGMSFLMAPPISSNQPTPWLGLVERINLGLYLVWVAVLAVTLRWGQDSRPPLTSGSIGAVDQHRHS